MGKRPFVIGGFVQFRNTLIGTTKNCVVANSWFYTSAEEAAGAMFRFLNSMAEVNDVVAAHSINPREMSREELEELLKYARPQAEIDAERSEEAFNPGNLSPADQWGA